MSFISLSFAVFFLMLVILYHVASHFKNNAVLIQNILLLASSFVFYAFADLRFVPFLLFAIAVSYIAGLICKNRFLFIIFLTINLVPLLALKYCPQILHTHWIFPLGISFFTFQSISYIADIYTKKIPAERNLLNVALFISFFPVISSGPIQRAGNLIPQFQNVRCFDYINATDGMKLFAWGMFKKICIADRIAVYVNHVYGNASDQYGFALLLATVLYSFQIYYDFSGYSDMAIGVAHYLGFDAGKNFDHPYLSQSIGEFWRRWHISLSSWLRDYVYIPLGGSRVALPRIYLNLMLTFLVSGIWHGSTWNFVIWGLLHGLFQCIGRETKTFWEKLKIPAFVRIVVTFCLVTFAWIFFRADSLHEAGIIISKIAQAPQDIGEFLLIKRKLGLKDAIKTMFYFTSGGIKPLFFFLTTVISLEIVTLGKNGLEIIKGKHHIIRWILYILLSYVIFMALLDIDTSTNTQFLYSAF